MKRIAISRIRRKVRYLSWSLFRKILEKRPVRIRKKLKSGLIVKLDCLADWVIFHEIFDEKEYDLSINTALSSAPDGRPFHVLDLGANVGCFSLRVADLIVRSRNPKRDFRITLVEGNPSVFEKLRSNIDQPLLLNKMRLVNGLVGELGGSAEISEHTYHVLNSVFIKDPNAKRREVKYINLFSLFDSGIEIDLLKCDVEGNELLFLENYKDLLARVRYVVIELHKDLCDVPRCYEIFKNAGFVNLGKQDEVRNTEIILWERKKG